MLRVKLVRWYAVKVNTICVITAANGSTLCPQVIDAFADIIPSPPYRVDLNRPDVTILVEVVHHSIGVCVVPNFLKYQKFNMLRLQEEGYRTLPPPKETTATQKDATNGITATEQVFQQSEA